MKKTLFLVVMAGVLTLNVIHPAFARTFANLTIGKESAPIKMEIFDDFQCPFCADFYKSTNSTAVRRLINHGDLKIVIKNFPLTFHQNAYAAAQAVNAATSISQKKGEQMLALLFKTQSSWEEKQNAASIFLGYAKQLNIDVKAFQDAYSAVENKTKIDADIDEGQNRMVEGTPTYFINGTFYSGAMPLRTLMGQLRQK